MIPEIFYFLSERSPAVKSFLWERLYQWLAGSHPKGAWKFMNYGYADQNTNPRELELLEEDEKNRYFIQLYHLALSEIEIERRKILEVSSGRGGGCDYTVRYLKPASITGIDFSKKAVELCRNLYQHKDLRFEVGNAENIPLADRAFDAVINVEASHCYGAMDKFVSEVKRVLKPGGFFSWMDLRTPDSLKVLEDLFESSGFETIQSTDITKNVIHALDLISEKKEKVIKKYVPFFLRKSFSIFAGVKNTKIYDFFLHGDLVYYHILLKNRF